MHPGRPKAKNLPEIGQVWGVQQDEIRFAGLRAQPVDHRPDSSIPEPATPRSASGTATRPPSVSSAE